MMLPTRKLKEARERMGKPAEDRSDEAMAALEGGKRVGFNQGDPLLERGYAEYPTGEDILRPEANDALETVARHERVANVEDVANELQAQEETVRRALELHGIDEPTETEPEDGPEEGDLDVPLHGTVDTDYLRTPIYEDARLLEHLYVRCGYGVGEIKRVLENQMKAGRDGNKPPWSVREAKIRGALEAAGLLEGDGNGEDRKDIRLGGTTLTTSDTGTIDYEKARRSSAVTVEPSGE